MGLHRFDNKHEQRKLWFKQNKSKITKISTITLSVIVFVVGVILLTKADFNSLFDLDMIGTKVGNYSSCSFSSGYSWTFEYTASEQEFSVPCNGTYKIELWGASGGDFSATSEDVGLGGYTSGEIDLNKNNKLYVYVGGNKNLVYTSDEDMFTYNGGGGGQTPGGGATDIRLVNGNWDNFDSLKSRIMVAAGGGGGFTTWEITNKTIGNAGGLVGTDAKCTYYGSTNYTSYGGTQTSGGAGGLGKTYSGCSMTYANGSFGKGGYGVDVRTEGGHGPVSSGGGGGYYGGGHGTHPGNGYTGGAGGSSYISGYSGCNSISQTSTVDNITHTGSANHYSDYVFRNATMIDGSGCNWLTGSATNCGANQVQPDGTSVTGHDGNGYARITLISDNNINIAPQVELYDGMIPVVYNGLGDTLVADVSSDWYNYDEHKWANAVLVRNSSDYLDSNNYVKSDKIGTIIPLDDILQYYVYIPRYKYKLFNTSNGSADEQMIEIEFQNINQAKATGTRNGEWLTHPAFTFGNTELNGFWVGKFEPSISSGSLTCTSESCDVSNLRVLPNKTALGNITLGNMFYITRSIEKYFNLNDNQVDSHMAKNMEWGAIAYLASSSYGLYTSTNSCNNVKNSVSVGLNNGFYSNRCQVWTNPKVDFVTGCSGANMNDGSLEECLPWDNPIYGGTSSTTGNIYGVYDMSGGSYEYVMGNVATGVSSYTWSPGDSGLGVINSKYYDSYTNVGNTILDHANGKLGDATKETMKNFGVANGGWFSDYATFPEGSSVFFIRSGDYSSTISSGLFIFSRQTGMANGSVSFRTVITKD